MNIAMWLILDEKIILSDIILVLTISFKASLSHQHKVLILTLSCYLWHSIWQNMLLFCLLYIRYHKPKKTAFGRPKILVRCDMQKMLRKGDKMNQRLYKCNSRKAFIIDFSMLYNSLFLGLGNVILLKCETSYSYTKQ